MEKKVSIHISSRHLQVVRVLLDQYDYFHIAISEIAEQVQKEVDNTLQSKFSYLCDRLGNYLETRSSLKDFSRQTFEDVRSFGR